jgi:hypothetical protein
MECIADLHVGVDVQEVANASVDVGIDLDGGRKGAGLSEQSEESDERGEGRHL